MTHDQRKHKRPKWVYVAIGVACAVVLTVVIVHLAGGGMGGHGL